MKIEASILKFKNFTIPINHYKQEKSNGLLIVFPGGGYSSNAPALYYTINFYQEHFFDVLTIDYDFKTFHYEGDRDLFLKELGIFIFEAIDKEFKVNRIHLVAKSIGTRIIAKTYADLNEKLTSKIENIFLLTPSWTHDEVLSELIKIGPKAMHIIGTNDKLYSEEALLKIQNAKIPYLVLPQVDHSFDIENDIIGSISAIKIILTEIKKSSWNLFYKIKLFHLAHTKENVKLVQQVLEGAPEYSKIISGNLPSKDEGEDIFTELPPKMEFKNKFVIGVYLENKMIGVIDYVVGYPDEKTIYLGLLLLKEEYQNQKRGTEVYQELENIFKMNSTIEKIRLSVVETNTKGISFWTKMGFHLTGEIKPYENKNMKCQVLLMERRFQEPFLQEPFL